MQASLQEDQNSESINLVKYLILLWHWAWLIVLVVVIAAAGGYIVSKLIPPVYEAKTTILVDMAPSNKSLDYNTLMLSSQLTQTYSQMLTKTPVLEEVAARLGITKVDPKTITNPHRSQPATVGIDIYIGLRTRLRKEGVFRLRSNK